MFFGFDRINYSRWSSIFYEDSVSLSEVCSEFVKGKFVVSLSTEKVNSIAMDQTLVIIGITRRKEAVAQHASPSQSTAEYRPDRKSSWAF